MAALVDQPQHKIFESDEEDEDHLDGGDVYLSDLSDYFDEDAHLLDDAMMGVKVQELSLDEVSYERDINKVNVASNVKLQRGRINPADLAKLHDVPTRDPRDPTYVKSREKRRERRRKPREDGLEDGNSAGAGGKILLKRPNGDREGRRTRKIEREPIVLQRPPNELTGMRVDVRTSDSGQPSTGRSIHSEDNSTNSERVKPRTTDRRPERERRRDDGRSGGRHAASADPEDSAQRAARGDKARHTRDSAEMSRQRERGGRGGPRHAFHQEPNAHGAEFIGTGPEGLSVDNGTDDVRQYYDYRQHRSSDGRGDYGGGRGGRGGGRRGGRSSGSDAGNAYDQRYGGHMPGRGYALSGYQYPPHLEQVYDQQGQYGGNMYHEYHHHGDNRTMSYGSLSASSGNQSSSGVAAISSGVITENDDAGGFKLRASAKEFVPSFSFIK